SHRRQRRKQKNFHRSPGVTCGAYQAARALGSRSAWIADGPSDHTRQFAQQPAEAAAGLVDLEALLDFPGGSWLRPPRSFPPAKRSPIRRRTRATPVTRFIQASILLLWATASGLHPPAAAASARA